MLTSKDVIERTGISRATLNNYISWGLVARPEVLPPQPDDGAAPRIGYFPDDVIERIEEIQRLKREGWSMAQITERLGGTAGPAEADVPKPQGAALAPATGVKASLAGSIPGLSIDELAHPAYMVDRNFDVIWMNDAAHQGASSELVQLPPDAVSHGIFRYLLHSAPADAQARRAILKFHAGLARQLGTGLRELCHDLTGDDIPALERLYQEAEPVAPGLVAQAAIARTRGSAGKPLTLYAVHFRQGILFLYVPAGTQDMPALLAEREAPGAEGGRKRVAALNHVAVLVTDLQDASRLWSELPPEEYFDLVNQIWLTADPIFRRHRALPGKHPGEGMVWYFFPEPDSSYLWNALAAAHQLREAMRRVSKEWQLRKGWPTELYMNTGIDEGQEWLGTWKTGAHVELTMLGETLDHAAQISNFSREGAVWASRNLVTKLSPAERQRLRYGVRRIQRDGHEVFVPSIFSRMENLVSGSAPAIANAGRLAIAQLLDIAGLPDRTGAASGH